MGRLNLKQIKSSAFGQWCKKQTRIEAARHLFECLERGEPNNMAWQLVELLQIEKISTQSILTMVDFLQREEPC
jgi:hypothetical protein